MNNPLTQAYAPPVVEDMFLQKTQDIVPTVVESEGLQTFLQTKTIRLPGMNAPTYKSRDLGVAAAMTAPMPVADPVGGSSEDPEAQDIVEYAPLDPVGKALTYKDLEIFHTVDAGGRFEACNPSNYGGLRALLDSTIPQETPSSLPVMGRTPLPGSSEGKLEFNVPRLYLHGSLNSVLKYIGRVGVRFHVDLGFGDVLPTVTLYSHSGEFIGGILVGEDRPGLDEIGEKALHKFLGSLGVYVPATLEDPADCEKPESVAPLFQSILAEWNRNPLAGFLAEKTPPVNVLHLYGDYNQTVEEPPSVSVKDLVALVERLQSYDEEIKDLQATLRYCQNQMLELRDAFNNQRDPQEVQEPYLSCCPARLNGTQLRMRGSAIRAVHEIQTRFPASHPITLMLRNHFSIPIREADQTLGEVIVENTPGYTLDDSLLDQFLDQLH